MNKDREIQELTRYNNQYLDYMVAVEQRLNEVIGAVEKQLTTIDKSMAVLECRISRIEKLLKKYHLD